ncbi:hypothetical protein [Streptomyces sp. NPDC048845]|uniref:hypothetical protein n=1 Tax=Streptomyces sp. NPDC048845 TaxID=3155390 RepID=UPI00342B3677
MTTIHRSRSEEVMETVPELCTGSVAMPASLVHSEPHRDFRCVRPVRTHDDFVRMTTDPVAGRARRYGVSVRPIAAPEGSPSAPRP